MKEMKRILSLVLCLMMLVSMIPGTALTAFAADETTYVLACSDFQNKSGDSAGATTVTNILNTIKNNGYTTMDGFLFGGDLSQDMSTNASTSGKKALQNAVQSVYGTGMDEIYVQGNHDPDDTVGSVCTSSGAHDTDAYGVYVINEKDYPWGFYESASSSSYKTTVQATATALKNYLDAKKDESYSKPIFVASHIPLHYTTRTSSQNDAMHANLLFDVLNSYDDLNIIFLFGHNHSTAYDSYLGQGSIYLKKGDKINIAQGSTTSYEEETLNFTYMNYGYTGYIGSTDADATLTMTVFEITDNQVAVKRYSASGQHTLKAAGGSTSKPSGISANSEVYGQAVLSLSTGESTISEISADSGDSGDSGSGDNSGTTGGNVYTLDTDGIDAGEEYLIVSTGSDGTGSALTNNSGASTGTSVIISGGKITLDDADAVWIFSGAESGNIQNGTTGYYVYPSSTNGEDPVIRNATCDLVFSDEGNGEYTIKRNSSYSGYYVSSSSDWTYSSSKTSVYLFKKTGTGTGGGSTVTPEGGDWVTITEPDGGTTTYTYSQATSITEGGKYVIVGNDDDVALLANGTTMEAQGVTITGNSGSQVMTSTTELTQWTFSGTTSGTVYNGTNYLYSSSNGYTFRIDDSSDTLYFTENGSNFQIKGSSSRNGYSFYYDGSEWATSGSSSRQYVRLFQLTGTTPGDDATPGLFAKITGNLEYNVERGLTDEQVLALVQAEIKGYKYEGTSAPGADVTGTDITEDLDFVLDSNYNGAKAGEYAVNIYYEVDGTKHLLGTAKVIVPEVEVTGCTFDKAGSVKLGATGKVRTGANITVNQADGTSYTVPVTLDMLSGNFTTAEAGTYSGLTVTYTVQGKTYTINDFTLTVREPVSYPEYPDEGAVQVHKTATGIDFQSTGVAQVEISASGIPMNQGVDVLLILDTSSSMNESGSLSSGTRIEVLRECVNELIQSLKEERADGSVPDVDISVVDFAGYLDYKSLNYIESAAKDTSSDKLGKVLLDWTSVQNVSDTWGNGINYKSGTNYDHGLQMGYDQLSEKQAQDNYSRKQFVLFMSDGAPFQYNGVGSSETGKDNEFEKWLLGTYTQDEVDALKGDHFNNPEFYFESEGGAQKNRIAEAIKGSSSETFYIPSYTETDGTWKGELVGVPGLGATMYSVGYALVEDYGKNPTGLNGMNAILKTIASTSEETGEKLFYPVKVKEDLMVCFNDFAGEALMAATNARFVDQMGEHYNLQLGQIKDLHGNAVSGVENKIEIISYDIWTRSDYLAKKCTLNQIGERKGTFTVLETITFNADGTEVYSDKIFTTDTDGNKTYPNILAPVEVEETDGYADGVIYAKNFMYNANKDKAVAVNGVKIPTGVGENGLTTGETNMLPAETFYWNIGTIKTTELAMRYYVYLDGSMEGTREAGSYPTNEYANLYYNNYLNQPVGQPCQKVTVSPVMAWDAANVSYAFYLVDENGNIIVNQTTGETGSFAKKIAVTNPVVYEEVLLNNTDTVESIEVASTGVLPEGYELYDEAAVYTIGINSDDTGYWNIAKSDGKTATTYVTHYDLENPAAYTNELTKNSNADFTHTIVWFAVVWEVQALPDTVVIDYGLPVDISVLTNDMFGENGKLAGVGAYSNSLNLDGHTAALATGFGNEYKADANSSDMLVYGDAAVYTVKDANGNDVVTGKVRYTPNTMEMNGYDKFAYAVNYTGATNPGYYYDTVTVIPATTIYYEDSFLKLEANNTSWEDEGTSVVGAVQAEDRPGQYSLTDANNIYGFDAVNNSMSQFSLGAAKKVHVDADSYATATFTFYGTGFDIISMTSNKTGILAVQLMDKDGKTVESKIVDTYYGCNYEELKDENDNPIVGEDGKPEMGWVPYPDVDKAMYQVPVMQASNLTYGKYTVKITATYVEPFDDTTAAGYDLYLDAVRIYDPANDGAADGSQDDTIEDAYVADGEGWPSYIELRNKLIDSGTLGNADTNTKVNGLVFIDGKSSVDSTNISDYVGYGPNNEVYLAKNQSIAFKLSDVTIQKDGKNVSIVDQIHMGIKSADGNAVTYTIKNIARNTNFETGVEAGDAYHEKTTTVSTATDMYYDITGYRNDIIVITNTSDGILSLTNIKATYTQNPNGAALQGQDDVIDEASENGTGEEPATNEVYVYMTPAAANLTLRSMRTPVVEEPEESQPTEPETTVPEETEPETTVPEETEPEEVDTTELEKAIREAKKYKSKDYTKASYNEVKTALQKARKVLNNENASQEEVDAAADALNDAVAKLVPVSGKKPNTTSGNKKQGNGISNLWNSIFWSWFR